MTLSNRCGIFETLRDRTKIFLTRRPDVERNRLTIIVYITRFSLDDPPYSSAFPLPTQIHDIQNDMK